MRDGEKTMTTTLTYLEFYSGIGGWGYALERACRSLSSSGDQGSGEGLVLRAQLLAAHDHSDLCNSVFSHNHRPKFSSSDISSKRRKKNNGNKNNNSDVYLRPCQIPIERLTLFELEQHSADIWCMSPPCQPHTRQHNNQHMESTDARSQSFLHLCKLLCDIDEAKLPKLILLENVIGFEKEQTVMMEEHDLKHLQQSTNIRKQHDLCDGGRVNGSSFDTFRRALSRRNYRVAHFHLDPTHLGTPNNRPRHYTVACRTKQVVIPNDEAGKMKDHQRPHINGKDMYKIPFSLDSIDGEMGVDDLFCRESMVKPPIIHKGKICTHMESLSSFLDFDITPDKRVLLQIPEKIRTSSSAWCFDIASPCEGRVTSCFTHSYGKFIRGTGSILYTGPPLSHAYRNIIDADDNEEHQQLGQNDRFQLIAPHERIYDTSWSKDLDWELHMRYFSGTEIARLMGFPLDTSSNDDSKTFVLNNGTSTNDKQLEDVSIRKFSFPKDCTMRQQWKMLGNSLNVRVAARVAEIGIQSLLNDFHRGNHDNSQ
jgi:tRNA (cytosine38-C5)-methyltransferase